jgi:hypothetical protein
VATKYAALTQYLVALPRDKEVTLDLHDLAKMAGGLPPSAVQPNWWANTLGHTQARAWLAAGRKVHFDGRRAVFSTAGEPIVAATGHVKVPQMPVILNGVASLAAILRRAGYSSTVAAVAEYTVFLDPRTVEQTKNHAVFPVIRNQNKIGEFDTLPDGRDVMFDDNTTPTRAFLWAAACKTGPDMQYNHVWTAAKDPDLYTALWNLCATPAFLAKTTDGKNHSAVRAALQYRAFRLYGAHPPGQRPVKPPDYDELRWAPMPDHVSNLEKVFRSRLAASSKSRPALAARTIGWLFSDWKPDPTIGVDVSMSAQIDDQAGTVVRGKS